MFAPVLAIATASSQVTGLLGSNPTRLYLFGEAPQNVARPYAVWQSVSGWPENYLGRLPDADNYTIQIDVYADTVSSARAVAEALRDAFEPVAHVVSWRGESKDRDTNHFRYSFDLAWIVPR